MKIGKTTQRDIDSMLQLGSILQTDFNNYPIDPRLEGEAQQAAVDAAPEYFDTNDLEHLQHFYRLIQLTHRAGAFGRVVIGMATLMDNDAFDPDLDYMDLHPRYRSVDEQKSKALATEQLSSEDDPDSEVGHQSGEE